MILAFTHPGYVLTGWGIALVGLVAYAARTVLRGRRLAERVAPEERRWT